MTADTAPDPREGVKDFTPIPDGICYLALPITNGGTLYGNKVRENLELAGMEMTNLQHALIDSNRDVLVTNPLVAFQRIFMRPDDIVSNGRICSLGNEQAMRLCKFAVDSCDSLVVSARKIAANSGVMTEASWAAQRGVPIFRIKGSQRGVVPISSLNQLTERSTW